MNIEEALKTYQRLHQQNPEDISLIQHICLCWVQLGQPAQAKQWLQHIIERLPPDASLFNTLGNLCARQQQEDEALAAYQEALRVQPDYPGALTNLGNYYQRQAQDTAAKTCYEKAIAIAPHYADAHFNLARLLVTHDDLPTAQTHLEQVLHSAPQHAAAQGLLGQLYLQLHQPEPAIRHLTKRLEIQPQHTDSYQALGMAYLLQGNLKTALQYYLRHVEHHQNKESFYNIGVILSNQQRHSEAVDYFRQALDIDPEHLPSLLNTGALYLKENKIRAAVDTYRRALAVTDHGADAIQHILHALEGDSTPMQAPAWYVTDLFDHYAPAYEQHLTQYLHYQIPEAISKILIATKNPALHSLRMLDLGCGTGLMGAACAPFAKNLVGVDLSSEMLDQAKKKELYTELIHSAIEQALPLQDECNVIKFDVVLAADVLPYIGALDDLFSKVEKSLHSEGLFIFSIEKFEKVKKIEKVENMDFILQKNIRYAHSKNYLIRLAEQHHFGIDAIHPVVLRHQYHQPVSGYIFVLIKQ